MEKGPELKGHNEGPIMKLPEDKTIVIALRDKLAEYRKRLEKQKEKDLYKAPEFFTDMNYKIAVLDRLLTTGEVNTYELSRELNLMYKGFDSSVFNNACAVIEDYILTGGKKVSGGTGLKTVEKVEEK